MIYSMGPNGAEGFPYGLMVDTEAPAHRVVVETKKGTCEAGYIKIQTTAPLISIGNAPVGL